MRKSVLFIIDGLKGGGAEKALVDLLAHFDYTRYDVTLCVLYSGGLYEKNIPKEVKLVWLFVENGGYWNQSLHRKCFRYYRKYHSIWLMRFLLLLKVGRAKFDVIISFVEGLSLLFHSSIVDKARRNISWVHCDLLQYHWTENTFLSLAHERQCYEAMDEIVFVSDNVLDAFNHVFTISVPKSCIYNIVDIEKIKQWVNVGVSAANKMTIVAIGSLIPVKGFDRLIHVAHRLKLEGYDLFFQILGVGKEEKNLRHLCKQLECDNIVSFLGFQSPPYPILSQADICVSTSISEGFSLVIAEALALGIPVVSTKTSGAIELLGDGQYGILTDFDCDSIYEGLKQMIDDFELRLHYKNKAIERSDIFNVGKTMSQVYDVLSC